MQTGSELGLVIAVIADHCCQCCPQSALAAVGEEGGGAAVHPVSATCGFFDSSSSAVCCLRDPASCQLAMSLCAFGSLYFQSFYFRDPVVAFGMKTAVEQRECPPVAETSGTEEASPGTLDPTGSLGVKNDVNIDICQEPARR